MSEEGGKSPANKKIKKSKKTIGKDRYGNYFSDLSDNFGLQRPTSTAQGHVLHFHSVATGATVHFKAFLTQFEDTYESQWNDEPTFGRMDPISTFQRTKRNIKLAWDVPAASVEEAVFNLAEAERFISMLYPVYEEFTVAGGLTEADAENLRRTRIAADDLSQRFGTEAAAENYFAETKQILEEQAAKSARTGAVMVASPLMKLKFSNLIMDNTPGISIKSGAAAAGLVGKLSGLTYQPDIEHGFFGNSEIDGVGENVLIPQTITFACDFTVLHTQQLGWKERQKRTISFPYHSEELVRKKR